MAFKRPKRLQDNIKLNLSEICCGDGKWLKMDENHIRWQVWHHWYWTMILPEHDKGMMTVNLTGVQLIYAESKRVKLIHRAGRPQFIKAFVKLLYNYQHRWQWRMSYDNCKDTLYWVLTEMNYHTLLSNFLFISKVWDPGSNKLLTWHNMLQYGCHVVQYNMHTKLKNTRLGWQWQATHRGTFNV
jgi:hypothetical protein